MTSSTFAGPKTTRRRAATELVALLEERGYRTRRRGPDRWAAQCPAHDDRSPSLSITGAEDRVLIKCFGGCAPGDVVAAIGWGLRDLFDAPARRALRRPLVSRVRPVAPRQTRKPRQSLLEAVQESIHFEEPVLLTDSDVIAAEVDTCLIVMMPPRWREHLDHMYEVFAGATVQIAMRDPFEAECMAQWLGLVATVEVVP